MATERRFSYSSMQGGIFMEGMEEQIREYTEALIKEVDENPKDSKTQISRRTDMAHPLYGIDLGTKFPDIIPAVIEIPMGSRVKTELDIETGLLKVNRILHSSTIYPANYGFIPQTIAGDINPLDILVLTTISCPPCSIIHARPIGIMKMSTDGEIDAKIIAVAIGDPEYNIYKDVGELPPFKLAMIHQFFKDYKTLERKVVICSKPKGQKEAKDIIVEYHNKYLRQYGQE